VRELHVERPIRLVHPEKRVLSHAARAFLELIQERVAAREREVSKDSKPEE